MQTGIQPERLKNKIKQAWLSEMNGEDGEDYLDKMSGKLANAICEELLEMIVEVPAGINVATTGTATAQTGATTEVKKANLS